jgi:hypothetical protein
MDETKMYSRHTNEQEEATGPPAATVGNHRLLVVAHPGDEILAFLSILLDQDAPPLWVLVCCEGATDRANFLHRLAREGKIDGAAFNWHLRDRNRGIDISLIGDFLRVAAPGIVAEVWTHNPADPDPQRCQVAIAVCEAFPGAQVFYSHGINTRFQFIADVCRPLTEAQVRLKMETLNCEYADQARYRPHWSSSTYGTESVQTVERFLRLSDDEARRLYAVRHSVDPEAAIVEDPWDMSRCEYEKERIDRSVSWIRQRAHPTAHTLVEVGSCEGAMTERLIAAGYRNLTACEPNPLFHSRLVDRLRGSSISISSLDLASLSKGRPLPADFYLMLEMLYYIQDFNLLNSLPTERLLVATSDEFYYNRIRPWLECDQSWRVAGETVLVEARVDFCVSGKVLLRRTGSRGIILTRSAQSPRA